MRSEQTSSPATGFDVADKPRAARPNGRRSRGADGPNLKREVFEVSLCVSRPVLSQLVGIEMYPG